MLGRKRPPMLHLRHFRSAVPHDWIPLLYRQSPLVSRGVFVQEISSRMPFFEGYRGRLLSTDVPMGTAECERFLPLILTLRDRVGKEACNESPMLLFLFGT